MPQLEPSASDQGILATRDSLQSEDDDFQRKNDDRRRPGRADDVNPNLAPLLRGEAVSYRPLSDEIDPPYGLEHTTPMFGIAITAIFTMPWLGVLGLMIWAFLR